MKKKFKDIQNVTILLDFNNQVMRSLFGTDELINSDGINTACIIGFIKILKNAITETEKVYAFPKLVVCYDRSPTRKRKLYKKYQDALNEHSPDQDWDGENKNERIRYKGNRKSLDLNYDPFKIVNDYLSCIIHEKIWCDGEEADDVMASYIAQHHQDKIFLYSTDKDMWQLEDAFPNITILLDSNKKVTDEKMDKTFETTNKNKIALHKMLRGDSGDNVKGIKNWQFKKTIEAYQKCNGTIDSYIYHLIKIFGENHKYVLRLFENFKLLELNKKLVTLKLDIKYDKDIIRKYDIDKWRKICHIYETPSLLNLSLLKIY